MSVAPVPWHRAIKQLAGGQTSFPSKTMSLVQQAPIHALASLATMDCQYPSIDLDGGELISKEHHEEIDDDGVRIIVYTFVIRNPDGWEVTKKIRQKINVIMTNYQQNIRVTNGCEAEVETKCEQAKGDIFGIQPSQSVFQTSRHTLHPNDRMMQLDLNNPKDLAIQDALCQVSDNFKGLLSQRQGAIMKMFPDLFTQMRTKSTLIPTTNNTEVVLNPDGSTTTRTKTSKSFSSSYSSSDVYVNGVRQEAMSKRRFKAFVEYKGPESGFRMKLTDDAEADLSEDETEEDDFYTPRGIKGLHALTAASNNDTRSEITDTESEIRPHHSQHLRPDAKKRMEKAWFAAKELVDSEQRYVEKLKLLADIFRQKVLDAKILDKDKANKLFANISSLYQFHNTHFLPQLMEASRDWHSTKRIANVVRKQAPFLKMYSEYTNNYDRATKMFEECKKKNRKFVDIVAEVERLPDCEGLPLQHHLICPVQRVMRYQLLLQEYKKHLTAQDVDFADSEIALNLVLQAATHANEMMKKLEGFGKVIEVQEELGNAISLVSPGRELLRRGVIQKISSTTEKAEDRTLFLFNDLIIMASDKRIGSGKKVRAVFSPTQTQVCEGDNLEREHSFYLRGSDGSGPQRCVELFCDTQREKREWMEGICTVIDDCKANSATFGGSERSSICETVVPSESKHCCDCDAEFSLWSRGIKCGQCRRKLCKKCFGRYRTESKNNRICESCVKNKDRNGVTRSQSMFNGERKNLLSVPATGEGVIHGGWVKFKGSQNKIYERYLAVREDFCMYSYVKPTDSAALLMLPLPGCEVRMCGEAYSFLLKVGTRREYKLLCDSEESQAHWMALLDLAANAQIKS